MHVDRVRFRHFFVLSLALIFLCAQAAFAETPAVTQFTADPASINNDYTVLLSWTASNSTGSTLYFSCPTGVTLTSGTGSAFPCNTRQSYSANASDSAGFTVTNVSGVTKNVVARIYPRNAAGVDYDAGAMSASFTVGTSPQPITDFSVSSSTVLSGGSVTLTWKGVDTSGTNITLDCAADIRIAATSPSVSAQLPCNVPAFSTDLPRSGSVVIAPQNSSVLPVTIYAHILPVIAAGTYDGTHALSLAFTVAGKPPRTDPSVSDFRSSQTSVASGVPFTLSWATKNAAGANIQISCNDNGFSLQSITGTSSAALSCNRPAFSPALPTTGSTTVAVVGSRGNVGTVTISLLPQDSNGTYFGTTAQTLNINITSANSVSVANSTTPPSQGVAAPIATSAGGAGTQMTSKNTNRYTFTLPLRRGSRNADVTALQTYLAKDPDIYPNGLITGYFGPATGLAVGRFQEKYGITTKEDSSYGTVGPKTRAKLNALQ